MKQRTYDEISRVMIDAIVSREEVQALTDQEIEKLRRLGNTIDNMLYLEVMRREKAAQLRDSLA